MDDELTVTVGRDGEWFIATCPGVPGANGQGATKKEALDSLRDAIELILEDRRGGASRGLPVPEAGV